MARDTRPIDVPARRRRRRKGRASRWAGLRAAAPAGLRTGSIRARTATPAPRGSASAGAPSLGRRR
jgi:hypothetical protein